MSPVLPDLVDSRADDLKRLLIRRGLIAADAQRDAHDFIKYRVFPAEAVFGVDSVFWSDEGCDRREGFMKRRKIIGWTAAVAVGLALVVAMGLSRKSLPPLPPLVQYPQLPVDFARALELARANVTSWRNDPESLRALARLYQANRLFAEAESCYRVMAESGFSYSARDHYLLADIAQNSGNLRAAEGELRAVLELDPAYLPARIGLADTLFKSGAEEEAAAQYRMVLASDPHHPQASLGLARLELQRDDDVGAIARLEGVLAQHPEFTSGAALLAQVLTRLGQGERAAALSEWSRQKREPIPRDPWLDALLADCYDSQRLALKFEELLYTGQMDAALPLLDRVEQLDPANWTPHLLKGWSQAKLNRHQIALDQFKQSLAKGGDPERICPFMVTSFLALENLAGAVALTDDHLDQRPESVPILTVAADLAARQGNVPRAKSLLTRILAKEPYLYAQNLSLAKILWEGGEREEAVKCLQRIVTVFPVDIASRGLMGQYFLEKGDAGSAILPLEQALVHAPDNTPARQRLVAMLDTAYLQTGMKEAEAGRYAAARSAFEKAAQLFPNNLNAWLGEANASVQLKDWTRASAALRKLAATQPDNPTIHLSLGDVMYQGGEHALAREQWQRALALTPITDGELRAVLERRINGPVTAEMFQ